MSIARLRKHLRSPWVTFAILVEAIILPAICVIWLVGRASDNERAALQQVYLSIQQRETMLVRGQIQETVRGLDRQLAESSNTEPTGVVVGWFLPMELLHDSHELDARLPDPAAAGYLEELRYLEQTFGSFAAIEQIRFWLREGTLKALNLSGGRSLEGAVLLRGMELEGEVQDEFQIALRNYLLSGKNRLVEGSFFRIFLISKILVRDPGAVALLQAAAAEQAAAKFIDAYQHHAFPLSEILSFHNEWVLREVHMGERDFVWFCPAGQFKDWVLSAMRNDTQDQAKRYELLEPGRVLADANPLILTMDVADPLEGWRLSAQLDESAVTHPANQRVFLYLWVGILTTTASILFAAIGMGLVKSEITLAKLKNDLAATVSHELKTPIASVRILVDTLLEGQHSLEPRTREYLELIDKENKRLGVLVEKFLTFSRMERGVDFLQPEWVDLNAMIHEAARIFEERFSEKDYTLAVVSEACSCNLWIDPQAMLSAIGNLLENAHKYSRAPRDIRLLAAIRSEGICIEVQDNGEGIDPLEQKKIFRKFYQPDRRLNRHRGGVGLGLSIVAYVVKQHRGRIELESALGKGSLFRIVLPHAKDTDH